MLTLMRKAIFVSTLFLLIAGAGVPVHAQNAPSLNNPISRGANTVVPNTPTIPVPGAGSTLSESALAAQTKAARDRLATESSGGGISGGLLGWIGLKSISFVLFALNYLVGLIGSVLFSLASLLVEFGLYLNTTILQSQVVQLGWRIMRDLANLGFTIGIVVIAYATMLGNESFGIKKTLLNFIVAAVMINFSFSIAGFMIDASNLVTQFFVSKSIGGGASTPLANAHQFALSLAGAFGPQKLVVLSDKANAFQGISSQNGGLLSGVMNLFFIALFTVMAALGMLAIGLTTFKRFLLLSVAIIAMPGAILCSVFPKTQKHWNKWKTEFLDQLFYLPTATFAIYLVLMFVSVKSKLAGSPGAGSSELADALGSIKTDGWDSALSYMAHPFQIMTDMIITLGLMMTAIVKSSSMSGASGKIAVEWAEGVRDWAVGAAKSIPGTLTRRTLTSPALSGSTDGVKDPNKNLGNRIGNFLAGKPLVRRLVPTLKGFMANSTGLIKQYEGEYNGLTDTQLFANARSAEIRLSPERMAAIAKVIASKGKFSDDPTKGLSAEEFAAFTPSAKRFGIEKEILKTSPQLYEKFGWNTEKLAGFMAKDFTKADMEKINPDALKNKEVVKNLRNRDLKTLNAPDKAKHRANLITTLAEIRTENPASFKSFMKDNFKSASDIDDIHPDFLSNADIPSDNGSLPGLGKDFVTNLNPVHINRIEKDGEFEKGAVLLKTMNEAYEEANQDPGNPANVDKIKTLDSFAKNIVDHKDSMLWASVAKDSTTQEDFNKVREEYMKRHEMQNQIPEEPEEPEPFVPVYPAGGGGPSVGGPAQEPETPVSRAFPVGGGGPSTSATYPGSQQQGGPQQGGPQQRPPQGNAAPIPTPPQASPSTEEQLAQARVREDELRAQLTRPKSSEEQAREDLATQTLRDKVAKLRADYPPSQNPQETSLRGDVGKKGVPSADTTERRADTTNRIAGGRPAPTPPTPPTPTPAADIDAQIRNNKRLLNEDASMTRAETVQFEQSQRETRRFEPRPPLPGFEPSPFSDSPRIVQVPLPANDIQPQRADRTNGQTDIS